MDTLYPNLHERFKTEGLCGICLMETELTPKYACVNGHTMCHRCKPYYYSCPTCRMPLDVEILPPQVEASSSAAFMAQPISPRNLDDHSPSAPPMRDFLNRERQAAWRPPIPTGDQQLKPCSYSHLGCWVKVPTHLQTLHESRCQFRPHLEQEHLPTDLQYRHDDLVACSYAAAGCKIRTVPWRRSIHESYCSFRNKSRAVSDLSDDLAFARISDNGNELVECLFRRYGCMVRMPRRRKFTHEQNCNYRHHYKPCDWEPGCVHPREVTPDSEEQVECRWFDNGCRVRPKRSRKQIHEDSCNYRMVECAFKKYGCYTMIIPARKYAHEKTCEFATNYY